MLAESHTEGDTVSGFRREHPGGQLHLTMPSNPFDSVHPQHDPPFSNPASQVDLGLYIAKSSFQEQSDVVEVKQLPPA